MAFQVKYRSEYKDLHGADWKIDILEDPWAGAIITLTPTGDPLNFDYDSASDDIFDPIKESFAKIGVMSSTNFALADLYATEELHFKVNIYQNAALYWTGWVDCGNYTEPYEIVPYPVLITATDGLSSLEDMLYKYQTTDPDDTYYEGRTLASQILIDILGKIGVTTFREYINIYENSMDSGDGDSPLDQTSIDVDIFKDMNCDEVLSEILKPFGSIIRQTSGVFCIYRPIELSQSTVHGRAFTSATVKSSISLTPEQFIKRSGSTSDLIQVKGGVTMINDPVKKVSVNQSYGHKQSWIENWQFKQETYSNAIPSYPTFEGWLNVDCGAAKITSIIPSEVDGMVITGTNTYPTLSHCKYRSFAPYAQPTTDILGLSFEYLFNYSGAGSILSAHFYIRIRTSTSSHYIYDVDGKICNWDTTARGIDIVVTSLSPGNTGWIIYQRNIEGLPASGPYTIEIFGLSDLLSNFNVAIKNIQFYAPSTNIVIRKINFLKPFYSNILKRFGFKVPQITMRLIKDMEDSEIVIREYIKSNVISGVELNYKCLLGDVSDASIDNVIEQFAGSLATGMTTLSKVAAAFVTDHAAHYLTHNIIVTSSGVTIIFTANVPGVDFTGSTTITNTVTNLAGSVVATHANVPALAGIVDIVLSGTSGTADISANGYTETATFNASLGQTATDFVNTFAAGFATVNVELTVQPVGVVRLSTVAGSTWTTYPAIVNVTPDLAASDVAEIQEAAPAEARIDTITLTGSTGTANILCNAVTEAAGFTLEHTTTWSSRDPGLEAKELLQILADGIANNRSRPTQLIQMEIQEDNKVGSVTSLNLIGNLKDTGNTFNSISRIFAINRGRFNAKRRNRSLDLVEMLENPIV
jgi:hypothetical protein